MSYSIIMLEIHNSKLMFLFFTLSFSQKSLNQKSTKMLNFDKDFKSFYDDIRYLNRIFGNINFNIKILIPH